MRRTNFLRVLCAVTLIPALCWCRPQVTPASDPVNTAADHLYNLEYDQAQKVLSDWVEAHPNDLRALNLLANTILRKEMYRKGLMEVAVYGDEGDVYKPAKTAPDLTVELGLMAILDRSLRIATDRLHNSPADMEALYWAGVSYGTRGIYNFSIKRSYTSALGDSKNAVKFHRKLLELNKEALDPLLTIGVHNYVVGSLPWYLKIMATLSGTHGDKAEGLLQIKRVTENGNYARNDARFVYALLTMREGNTVEALAILQSLASDFPRNYLLMQEVAGVYRVRKEWPQALAVYDAMFERQKSGAPGFSNLPLPRLLYLAGQSASNAGEQERALRYYQQAVALGSRDIYVTRAQLEAAKLLEQTAQHEQAQKLFQQVIETAPRTEEAKSAKKALQHYKRPSG